jgi:L-ribulose-5-phosphate 3-epimerase
MTRIGIMQGRLVPPVNGRIQAFPVDEWREEFPRAASAELGAIEWIYETHGRDRNPLASEDGILEMRTLSDRHHVAVRSLCADYFMEAPLVRASSSEVDERLAHLDWLLDRCRRAGILRVVLPFVDNSEVRTMAEQDALVETLHEAERLTRGDVELHLEMSLAPSAFAGFLERLPDRVRVNYDSGNSASLGYDAREEFAAYGDRVGSVHIKDRVRGGTTVPLGTGNADLKRVFAELNRIGYSGDLILQVARGEAGREIEWARHNRAYVERALV